MSNHLLDALNGMVQGHMTATEMQQRMQNAQQAMQLAHVHALQGLPMPDPYQVMTASMDTTTPAPERYTGPLRVIDKLRRNTMIPDKSVTVHTGALVARGAEACTERNIKAVAQSLEATLSMAEGVDDMEMLPIHLRHDELKHFVAYIKMLDAEYRQLEARNDGLQREIKETYNKYVKLKGATYSEPEKGKTVAPDSAPHMRSWGEFEKELAVLERRAERQERAAAERDQRAKYEARYVSLVKETSKKWASHVGKAIRRRTP